MNKIEEIVKSLEEMYVLNRFRTKTIKKAIDIIHRLQSDNERLTAENQAREGDLQIAYKQIDEFREKYQIVHKENVETRLERNEICARYWEYVEKCRKCNETITEQKAEIERLKEEKKEIWDERNRICKGYWETMDECHQYRDRNAELQKQVDKLLNRQVEPKIFQCHADALENCPKVEQAIKDTAKKYHDAVKNMFDNADCCGWIEDSETKYWHDDNDKIAREQFGVEVE